jgi:hypothetical protein
MVNLIYCGTHELIPGLLKTLVLHMFLMPVTFSAPSMPMTVSQGWQELIAPNDRQPGVVGTDHA